MICLDTNVVVAYLRRQDRGLVEHFQSEIRREPFAVPSIVLFELRFGIAKSSRKDENTARLGVFLQLPLVVLPFGAADAEEAGEVRAALERAGAPIGPYDVLIAAQARRLDAVLVTANGREFSRVPRLKIEDWSAL
ncbi:MAG TPA: type II toxin-antitoxin system VapC family toxin [Hyphomicrobiales bacterium]|nr:type II toxin-antitoxin system VapC family toxin [Hyphomicrobiales bacterium]